MQNVNSINNLIAFNDGSLCNIVFKSELFNDLELPNIYHGEDMAVVPLLISKAHSFIHVNENLYHYEINNNSLSNSVSAKACKELLNSFEFLKNNIHLNYAQEVEFCGIKQVLYGYTLNAFKANFKKKDIKFIIKDFKIKYPKWNSNIYLKKFGFKKKCYLKCIQFNFLFLNRLYAKLHSKLLKKG